MKIVNIVTTIKLRDGFDLNQLSKIFLGSKFPSNGPWLMWRTKDNFYVAFYKSGKILITCKTENQINQITEEILDLLNRSGIHTIVEKTEIHNIVLTDKIELNQSLDTLITKIDRNASFEPEQFPGLFYKTDEGINITLFSSGKLIMTGVKDIKSGEKTLKDFKKILSKI